MTSRELLQKVTFGCGLIEVLALEHPGVIRLAEFFDMKYSLAQMWR